MNCDPQLRKLFELLQTFNSRSMVRRRTYDQNFDSLYGGLSAIENELERIKQLSRSVLDNRAPKLTIAIPIYNEEVEILPTILSFLYVVCATGIPTEIIATDNNSTDRSRLLLERIGIKVVFRRDPGLRYARHSGLEASSDSCQYIWFVDADTRATPPITAEMSSLPERNALSVSYHHLTTFPRCIAVSTGVVFEHQPVMRRVIGVARRLILRGPKFSCWSGANQFIRKKELLDSGGIDLEVDGGEDHNRIYTLVRYAKKNGLTVQGADRIADLYAPVYTSDRRNSTLERIWRNTTQQLRKPVPPLGEDGLPLHPKGVRYKDLHRRERGQAKLDK